MPAPTLQVSQPHIPSPVTHPPGDRRPGRARGEPRVLAAALFIGYTVVSVGRYRHMATLSWDLGIFALPGLLARRHPACHPAVHRPGEHRRRVPRPRGLRPQAAPPRRVRRRGRGGRVRGSRAAEGGRGLTRRVRPGARPSPAEPPGTHTTPPRPAPRTAGPAPEVETSGAGPSPATPVCGGIRVATATPSRSRSGRSSGPPGTPGSVPRTGPRTPSR